MNAWNTTSLPDSEITVLIRYQHEEYPLVIGFHDGEHWRDQDASALHGQLVSGWMHLEDAARKLDT